MVYAALQWLYDGIRSHGKDKKMTTIHIKIEEEVKADVDGLFGSLGLDTETAIRMFLRAAIANGGFPFAVQRPRPNAALLRVIEDAEQGINVHGPYTYEEAIAALKAE